MMHLELDYCASPLVFFQHLAELDYAICLDSCREFGTGGRFDIMSAEPKVLIKSQNGITQLSTSESKTETKLSVFETVKAELTKLPTIKSDLPFSIGALGYYGYDLGRQLESLPNTLLRDIPLADACIGIYDWSIVLDHEKQQAHLFYSSKEQLQKIQSWLKQVIPTRLSFKLTKSFSNDISTQEYANAFKQIKKHLQAGDCYQVNLCQRFSSEYSGSPFEAYQLLRQKCPAPFSCYMNLAEAAVLSFSPERFVQVDNGRVLTQPIKGTRPRFADPQKDQASAEELKTSLKDQAENLMIVDLLRNDLSRNCRAGSVKVPALFELQSFSNVHHLVSSITAQLSPNQHPLDLLKDCFPGGSITGAPKISAMNIIERLEQHARSIYCGSIGYCSADGKMDSNIAIRTLICAGSKIYAYAGGGIVMDSECEAEYQESLTKINHLLRALDG